MKRLLLVGAFSCHLVLVVAGLSISRLVSTGPLGEDFVFMTTIGSRRLLFLLRARGRSPVRARFTLSTAREERSEERWKPGRAARSASAWGISRERSTSWPSAQTCDEHFSVRSRRADSARIRKRTACRWTSRIG